MKPTVVSFYTAKDPYPRYADRLRESCERHELEHVIEKMDPAPPDWIRTVALKGEYCYQKALELRRPILWVDADGEIVRPPELLYDRFDDFAVYADPKPRQWRPTGRRCRLELPESWPGRPRWFLTGTLWFNATTAALEFLSAWADEAVLRPRAYQQLLLQEVWCQMTPNTLWLPQAYTKIRGWKWQPGEDGPEVIVHDLASVKQKGIVRQ